MRLSIFGILILLTTNLTAQENQFNPEKKYHPDSLKRWTKRVMTGTSDKHPGFYRFTSKKKFDNLIDSTIQTIKDSLTELDYYRSIRPAKKTCRHLNLPLFYLLLPPLQAWVF